MKDEKVIIREVLNFHDNLLAKFKPKWEQAKSGIGLVYDDHWTEDEKAKYRAKDRVPISIPTLYAPIQSILGFEKSNRNTIGLDYEGKEDELNSYIGNQVIQYVLNKNDYEFEKDEVFENGVIATYGVFKLDTETDNFGKTEVKIDTVPYNRLLWDLNFKKYDRSDCSREQYFEWVYTDDLELMFPDKADLIKNKMSRDEDFNDQDTSPLNDLADYYESQEGKVLAKVIHDYKKVNKQVYELYDIINGGKEVFSSKEDAESVITEKTMAGMPAEAFIIKPVMVKRIEHTVCTLNTLLQEPKELDIDEFKHIVYFAIFMQGKWWSVTDIGRDTQHLIDKLMSQLDHSIATDMKTVFFLNKNKLDPINTPEDARRIISDGGIIFTTDDGDPLKPAQKSGADPAYFNMIEVLTSKLMVSLGGNNSIGVQETANESGIAVQRRQEAAGMLTYNYLNNLERFDVIFGRRLLELILKHYDQEFTIKVVGEQFTQEVMQALQSNQLWEQSLTDPNTGFLKVNSGRRKLKDCNFSVKVTSKNARANEKDIRWQKLIALQQTTQKPIPADIWLSELDLDPVLAQKLKQAWAQQDAMAAQQADAQMKLEEGKALVDGLSKIDKMLQPQKTNKNGI